MAFPTLFQVLSNVTLLVVGIPIVYLLSKVLKLRPKPLIILNSRKEATSVFLVIIATFVVTSALVVFVNTVINPSFQLDKRPSFMVDQVVKDKNVVSFLNYRLITS